MTKRIRRRSTKRNQRKLSKKRLSKRLTKRRLRQRRLSKRRVRRGGKPGEDHLGQLPGNLIQHIVEVGENDPKAIVNLSSASKGIKTALVKERGDILAKKNILKGLHISMADETAILPGKLQGKLGRIRCCISSVANPTQSQRIDA